MLSSFYQLRFACTLGTTRISFYVCADQLRYFHTCQGKKEEMHGSYSALDHLDVSEHFRGARRSEFSPISLPLILCFLSCPFSFFDS